MFDEKELSEEFTVTVLERYFQFFPEEARKQAINYYIYNKKLRQECEEFCKSSEELQIKTQNLIKNYEQKVNENKKLKSDLILSRLQILVLIFSLSYLLTVLFQS